MTPVPWIEIVVIVLAPALVVFLSAGIYSLFKHVNAWLLNQNEDVDHEL